MNEGRGEPGRSPPGGFRVAGRPLRSAGPPGWTPRVAPVVAFGVPQREFVREARVEAMADVPRHERAISYAKNGDFLRQMETSPEDSPFRGRYRVAP